MKKFAHIYTLFLLFVFNTSCRGQNKTDLPASNSTSEVKDVITSHEPNTMVRNVKKDSNGNILIAASFDGVFRYDGKSFTNLTSKVGLHNFWDILEDSHGNFWFSSVGSGVYYYDGKSVRNFTTKDGLANDRVTEIYEDKAGTIWFSTEGGASRYDGQSFRNFTIKDGPPSNNVNSIVEDKTGKFWFGTRGDAYLYDGKTFTTLMHQGKPFRNVRTIIEDKNGNIWLGGSDGLWCYDGSTFTNFTQKFVGYVYEDNNGNIWTSSDSDITKSFNVDLQSMSNQNGWTLSRYNEKSLSNPATLPEIIRTNEGMIFGILEADDGSIWFGTLHGVYRYEGKTITKKY